MANNIKVNTPAAPRSGQIVTFPAPCNCDEVTDGLIINGETYTVCDAMGECVTGKGGAWCAGAQISVVLDCENKKAFIQNAAVPEMTIDNVTGLQDALDDKVPIATSFTMAGDRVKRIQTGGNSGENGNITNGGIVLGQTYQDLKNPESGIGSMRGTRNYGIFCGCDYTDSADETTLGARSFVIKALDTLDKRPSALLLQGYEGGIKYFLAKEKRVYEQNELLEMDEFDVLHTGNMDSLGCPRIQTGSYVGTGTYGSSNPCSLTFEFVPKFVFIYTDNPNYYNYSSSAGGAVAYTNNYTTAMWGAGSTKFFINASANNNSVVSLNDKTLSWYATSDSDGKAQMNYKNSYGQSTYHWIAIG